MTRFSFTAMSAAGAGAASAPLVRGRREASDERALRAALRTEGLIAVDVRPVSAVDALRAAVGGLGVGGTARAVRRSEAAWFFQTLAMLLKHNVPIESALGTMHELAPNPSVMEACAGVRDALRGGASAADAVGKVPGLATAQHLALLRSAQGSGRLDHAVALIDQSIVSANKLRRTLITGLTYPAILLVACVGVLWVLATFVIPQFAETLESLGGQLPWQTAVTMRAANILVWAFPVTVIALLLAWRTRAAWMSPATRLAVHERLLRLPVFGRMMWNSQGAVVCDTLATMVEGGADVLGSLQQAQQVASSPAIEKRLDGARRAVREGIELGQAFKDQRVLPPTAQAVVQIGVRAGDLVGGLKQGAGICAEEQERVAQRLLSLLGPVVIAIMAVSVGWVVWSLVSGMLALNELGSSL